MTNPFLVIDIEADQLTKENAEKERIKKQLMKKASNCEYRDFGVGKSIRFQIFYDECLHPERSKYDGRPRNCLGINCPVIKSEK